MNKETTGKCDWSHDSSCLTCHLIVCLHVCLSIGCTWTSVDHCFRVGQGIPPNGQAERMHTLRPPPWSCAIRRGQRWRTDLELICTFQRPRFKPNGMNIIRSMSCQPSRPAYSSPVLVLPERSFQCTWDQDTHTHVQTNMHTFTHVNRLTNQQMTSIKHSVIVLVCMCSTATTLPLRGPSWVRRRTSVLIALITSLL